MKVQSMARSLILGYEITVYRCKKCGRETDDSLDCLAKPESTTTDFRPYQKAEPLKPWGQLVPNSSEYLILFTETAVEISNKRGITLEKAYLELLKQGWPLDCDKMSDELRQAALEAGLLGSKETEVHMREESQAVATEKPPIPSQESPIPLEEIIKQMQENNK